MARYEQTLAVCGTGPFPLDMLRYDQAWPATGEDAAIIGRSHQEIGVRWAVAVYKVTQRRADPAWTLRRRESFAVKVQPVVSAQDVRRLREECVGNGVPCDLALLPAAAIPAGPPRRG